MRVVVIAAGWSAMTFVQAVESRPSANAPSRETVSLQLIVASALSKPEIEGVRDQLTRIWKPVGIDVNLGPTMDSVTASGQQGQVRLVLSDRAIRVGPSSGSLCALGVIHFVDGLPQPEMTVSVTRVREFVRRAKPEQSGALQSLLVARIIGRVAAHELGHYLLADTSHTASGLMRAKLDGADLLAPHLEPFAPPARDRLATGLSYLHQLRATPGRPR
jgi:hypothetical protein